MKLSCTWPKRHRMVAQGAQSGISELLSREKAEDAF